MSEAPRLAKLAVAELSAEQRELYDSIAGGPRAQGRQLFALTDSQGGLEGPFNAMLLSPRLGAALQALGAAIRYDGALTPRAREIAILVIAHHWDSAFERYAHESVGMAVGLSAAELGALREVSNGGFTDPYEQLVLNTTRALVAAADLDDTEFALAAEGLGLPVLFEIMTLVGYYSSLALQLRVLRVGLPASATAAT